MPGQTTIPVKPGGTATFPVKIKVQAGQPFDVQLRVLSGLPAGANATFSPNPVSFSGSQEVGQATLTIGVPPATLPQDYSVVFRAEKSGATDPSGAFELNGMRPGDHRIHTVPPAGFTAVANDLRVAVPPAGSCCPRWMAICSAMGSTAFA